MKQDPISLNKFQNRELSAAIILNEKCTLQNSKISKFILLGKILQNMILSDKYVRNFLDNFRSEKCYLNFAENLINFWIVCLKTMFEFCAIRCGWPCIWISDVVGIILILMKHFWQIILPSRQMCSVILNHISIFSRSWVRI